MFIYLKGPHGVAREGGVGRGQRAGRVARELLVVHRKQGTDAHGIQGSFDIFSLYIYFWALALFVRPLRRYLKQVFSVEIIFLDGNIDYVTCSGYYSHVLCICLLGQGKFPFV